MLPRFTGRPLRWPGWATAQSWLAVGGVGVAALGWLSGVRMIPALEALQVAGGLLQAVAALLFAVLIADLLRS